MTAGTAQRILVGVDDSAAALGAVRFALGLAGRTGACLRFVHVTGDGDLVRALRGMKHDGRLVERRTREAALLLRHVEAEAERAEVSAETVSLDGEPAPVLLRASREWGADLVVLGRSEVSGPGRSYVGPVTRHVLEFSERPVVVVPHTVAPPP